jgi:hydroxyacylglutathione hydrolase
METAASSAWTFTTDWRPDLLEKAAGISGTMAASAKQMFTSVQKFIALPDHIQVWPGHGAASACGKALGAVPSSTVGYEKIRNMALQHAHNEKAFIKYLLEDQPEPPKYFSMMKRLNKVDRPLLTEVPTVKKLSLTEFKNALHDGTKVIDARPKDEFAKGFIPGTINIQGNNSFSTWTGWLMTYEEPLILIAPESQLDDLIRKLMRIGIDKIYGYVDGIGEWKKAGGKLLKADIISLHQFEDILKTNHTRVVDLRGYTEYNAGHIKGTENIFVGTLEEELHRLSKDEQVVILCQSGDRATIGYSLLRKHGFNNIRNYAGGMSEWLNKGKPVIIER